ncbi:TolC family protein [Granulicella sp. dw_53]|uniref:TolC family protein n=1 Tax=Granulicella sp. dw_53 TaxID=2719792 RepID=UPI001BD2AB94|nr:TolC family protein [Granulicella sp. dw_53]
MIFSVGSAQCLAQDVTIAQSAPVITLDEAIRRAQSNEPVFAAALADKKIAALDRSIARTAFLPSAVYHNQMLYTQPNGQSNQGGQAGSQPAPIFIANNAVHEYTSQAVVNETIGLQQVAGLKAATAVAARTEAEFEISRRGLVATVVALYYGVADTESKAALLDEGLREATEFTDLTRKREAAREAAHADVVKAQLQQQQRQRDLADARLLADKTRLELAVLLFPDPHTQYVTESGTVVRPLPERREVEVAAGNNNAELKSALASLHESDAAVLSARAAYLPDLALNFNYGIDAPQFAKRGPDDVRNLGYSMSATVDIPVWDWLSTQKRIKQSNIRRDAVKVALSNTQRRLIATLDDAYAEAAAAHAQIDLLEESSRTAEESLRLTKLRYSSGEGTVLEVVDAQNALIVARSAEADGTMRYENALATLQTLTGTL